MVVHSELSWLANLIINIDAPPVKNNAEEEADKVGPQGDGSLDEIFGVVLLRKDIADGSVGEVEREGDVSQEPDDHEHGTVGHSLFVAAQIPEHLEDEKVGYETDKATEDHVVAETATFIHSAGHGSGHSHRSGSDTDPSQQGHQQVRVRH